MQDDCTQVLPAIASGISSTNGPAPRAALYIMVANRVLEAQSTTTYDLGVALFPVVPKPPRKISTRSCALGLVRLAVLIALVVGFLLGGHEEVALARM
jgi:hypothetical protein